MEKVDLESIKPWISKRITDILHHEDDVIIDYVFNQLEPQYPDPKEIQSNLSGFFSLKNARIFLADLWKQLLDSMNEANNGKVKETVKDQIKTVSKLLSSEAYTMIASDHSQKQSSEHLIPSSKYSPSLFSFYSPQIEDDRHNDCRSYSKRRRSISRYSRQKYSRSKYGRSNSYNRKNRERHRSRSRYSRKSNHLVRRRSPSRSSSGHTPYTRYSDYTEDKIVIIIKSDTESFRASTSSSSSSESSSSDSSSPNSSSSESSTSSSKGEKRTFSKKSIDVNKTDTSLLELKSIKTVSLKSKEMEEKKDVEELNASFILEPNKDSLDINVEQQSCEMISVKPTYSDNFGTSKSRSCSSSKSQMITDEFSESSSSNYTIEYVEKSKLIKNTEDIDGLSTCSDIQWVTMEEYQFMNGSVSELSSSPSSCSGYSYESVGSNSSHDDVIWLEDYKVLSYCEQYDRL